MRAVNGHFVANPTHYGHFFSGGNPGHPLAGGLIAPLLDAGGFRHRYSRDRDLSYHPVSWRPAGDGGPDFGSGNVIDVPAKAWDGNWFGGAAGGGSHISATGSMIQADTLQFMALDV